MAENVVKAFKETHRIELVNRLREYGVNMIYRSSVSGGDGRFKGKTFVLTRTLPSMKRKDAQS